jgi:DcmR-like sensory protein
MTQKSSAAGHFHAVRFYKDADSLCRIIATFLDEGFKDHQPAVVIGTAAHRALIAQHLTGRGIDVDALQKKGDLRLIDADALLGTFMVDGMPDPRLFTKALVPVMEEICVGRPKCVIRAYGEMVDVLWKAGQTAAATRLEMLWNDLARTQSFSLLCGYAMGNFYKDAAVEEICSHHSHTLSDMGELSAVN